MRTVQLTIPARCLTGQAAANRFFDLLEGESPSHGFDYAAHGEFGYFSRWISKNTSPSTTVATR